MVRFKASASAARNIAGKLRHHEIPAHAYLGWQQAAEFDLSDSPKSKLRKVWDPDSFFEYKSRHKLDAIEFHLVWEIEWDEVSDVMYLIDVSFVPPGPTDP